MIDPEQLRKFVIRPVLNRLGAGGAAAEALLLGTAAQESAMGRYLRQLGGGPARGVFQMEPATHDDIWRNFLRYREDLSCAVNEFKIGAPPRASEMEGNLYYAAAMARCHYLRVPEALPAAHDVEAMARYWKRHYNTHLGAGKPEEFVAAWRLYIGG